MIRCDFIHSYTLKQSLANLSCDLIDWSGLIRIFLENPILLEGFGPDPSSKQQYIEFRHAGRVQWPIEPFHPTYFSIYFIHQNCLVYLVFSSFFRKIFFCYSNNNSFRKKIVSLHNTHCYAIKRRRELISFRGKTTKQNNFCTVFIQSNRI